MVSLIMPVWKPNPDWFRDAVRSVLAERACPIELIVVDDGSPEPADEMLRDFDDSRLSVIRVDHGGAGRARNAGIAQAGGDAIRFVDADDVVETGSTARLYELSGPDGAISYADTLVCDVDLRVEKSVGSRVEGDALIECLRGNFFVYITGMLFPRAVIEAVGDFDTDFAANGDYDYVLRAIEHAPVRPGDFIASRYRRHKASITGRQDTLAAGNLRALDKLFERRPDLRGTAIERMARARHQLSAANRMMRAGHYGAFARHTLSAMRISPSQAAPEAAALLRALPRLVARRALATGRRSAG